MLQLLLFLIVLVIAIWLIWTVTSSLIGVIFTVVIAGIVGWLADLIVPGRIPFGWLGAIAAGLLGSWLGVRLIGDLGPSVFGISLIPALLGAIILAFVADLIVKLTAGQRAS